MDRTPSLEVLSARQRAIYGLGIGLVVFGLCIWLRGTDVFGRPELALLDVRTQVYTGTRGPDPRIMLCIVTEDDLARMARATGAPTPWPWDQEVQSYAIDFLNDAGAAALICDFLFFDRGKAVEEIAPEYAGATTDQVESQLVLARRLGTALERFGRAAVGLYTQSHPTWETPGRLALAADRSLQRPAGRKAPTERPLGVDLSVAAIFQGARYGGVVNARMDVDGMVRSTVAVVEAGQGETYLWPTLGLAGAALLTGESIEVGAEGVRLGGRDLRLDSHGEFLINFRGPAYDTYPTVSFFDLVGAGARLAGGEDPTTEDQALRRAVKGKLIVWGAHYVGAPDVVATPLSGTYLGPELHATIADNFLHGDGRRRVPTWVDRLLLGLCCLGISLVGALSRHRLLPHLLTIGTILTVVVAGFLLFRAGWAIDIFTPVVAVFLTAVTTTTFRLLTEGRRNRWLENTFQRYLAPDVIEALKQDPSRVALGGRRRDLTIFFSDVAGFTSMTERLGSQQIVMLLNKYLTRQSALLMDESATIDKFQGDAIMAFFGDPLDMPDHTIRACRAAVECRRALPELDPLLRELGLEDFEIRIGLNSGQALVGNMGSEERFDYTCMGDAVNLAARLESANKAFGSKIMIGPETFAGAESEILAKRLADLVVVGKSEAVSVYELVAMQDNASDAERAHVAAYNEADAAVREGDLSAAREALDRAEAANPGDGPCAWLRTLIARTEAGEVEGPWDGHLVLDKK